MILDRSIDEMTSLRAMIHDRSVDEMTSSSDNAGLTAPAPVRPDTAGITKTDFAADVGKIGPGAFGEDSHLGQEPGTERLPSTEHWRRWHVRMRRDEWADKDWKKQVVRRGLEKRQVDARKPDT
jgi:hypothetical protein